jgi:hypothetical protein
MFSSKMPTASDSRPTGWRILGFGKHPEIAAAVQEKLRSLGFQATNFVLTNDEDGDARLVAELKRAEYDGVAIGGYINGQDAVNFPATEETTVWFNRVLNDPRDNCLVQSRSQHHPRERAEIEDHPRARSRGRCAGDRTSAR